MQQRLLSTFLSIALVLFSLHALAQNAQSTTGDEANPYLQALPSWAETLEKFVDKEGRIDFTALTNDLDSLQRFVKAIEQVSPASHPNLFNSREAVLAYHVNAYNALAMIGVIEREIPKNFSSLLKRASFFKFRGVTIGGKKTNLYDYENKVIRPLGEPRMHFLLNCMVKDCPRLPTKPITKQNLEQDLQTASIEFFNKPKHIIIDAEKEQVNLSGIMKFYTKDYVVSGKKQDLVNYVNQFREEKIPADYRVKFIKYDWTINQQSS